MTPTIDFRTNDVFRIEFRGGFEDKLFHVMNECRDIPQSLYERCINWLKGDDSVQ